MCRVLGVIAEYDPFHNGHLYHLEESKRITDAEFTVCVMSGEFKQRGNPAHYNKYLRAEAAIRNGADLVIGLPFVYACNNAEYFAKGAVDLLSGLGCIDAISFGSESGDISGLSSVAMTVAEDSEELKAYIKDGMSKGWSYPKARSDAVTKTVGGGAKNIISTPNDILGVEYIRRLIEIDSKIKPVAIKRFACAEDEISESSKVAGATAIRAMIDNGDDISPYIPKSTKTLISEYTAHFNNDMLLKLLLYSVSVTDRETLAEIFSASEGLENRLADAARKAISLEDLIRRTKTKRYTETRIRRLIAHTVMGLTKNDMADAEACGLFARILAFGSRGAVLLKQIKKSECSSIPIITNPNKQIDELSGFETICKFDRRAADVYRLLSSRALDGFDDSKISPNII